MPIELKICGINSKNIIQTIIQNGGCQYLGFIFYPSDKCNVSCLVPLKALSFIVSSVGVSSENKIRSVKYIPLITEIQIENTRFLR